MVKKDKRLNVWINGNHIGVLSKQTTGALFFSYAKNWLTTKGARPMSLSMPLRTQAYQGDLVYNFFDNLLPDNRAIRNKIEKHFKISSSHPFDLLAIIGKDCIGAVQLTTSQTPPQNIKTIKGEKLNNKQVEKILKGYQTNPLGMNKIESEDFRISLAGAQEKTALLWHQNQWQKPIGSTPTTHIFKLPIGRLQPAGLDLTDSVENEWLCLQILKAFGLKVCEAEIATFGKAKALIVKRFDRKQTDNWIMRLPQEDMCQRFGVPPNIKYQSDGGPDIKQIMQFLMQSHNAKEDRKAFFKSQVIFWLLGAIDGHAKNFSIFIQAEGRFKLTPFYDVLSVYPLIQKKQIQKKKVKMAMALKGKNNHYLHHNNQLRHFISTAKESGFNVETAEQIIKDVIDATSDVIKQVSKTIPSGFPQYIQNAIFDGMSKQQAKWLKQINETINLNSTEKNN